MSFDVRLAADDAPQITLVPQAKPGAGARLRDAWLEIKSARKKTA
jgi:hypothetical protein